MARTIWRDSAAIHACKDPAERSRLGMSEEFIAEVMGRKNPRRRRTVARRRR
jgi:hypothetical protein